MYQNSTSSIELMYQGVVLCHYPPSSSSTISSSSSPSLFATEKHMLVGNANDNLAPLAPVRVRIDL